MQKIETLLLGGGMNTDKPSTALHYPALLTDIKQRIRQAQTRAVLAVNAELIRLYWEIGQMLDARQKNEGWGAAVIPRLARDIRNELPEVKGFSERNIKRMLAFYREYRDLLFVPQAVAQIEPRKSATDCGTFYAGIVVGASLGASRFVDGEGQGRYCAPVVHAGDVKQRLEPQHSGDADRNRRPPAPPCTNTCAKRTTPKCVAASWNTLPTTRLHLWKYLFASPDVSSSFALSAHTGST